MPIRIDILSLFPEMFDGFLAASIVGRAIRRELVEVHLTNIRDFSRDRHQKVGIYLRAGVGQDTRDTITAAVGAPGAVVPVAAAVGLLVKVVDILATRPSRRERFEHDRPGRVEAPGAEQRAERAAHRPGPIAS